MSANADVRLRSGLSQIPGVVIASAPFHRLIRRLALLVVVTPFAGVVAALALIWFNGISYIDLVIFACMYIATVFGIEVGYHRLISHCSFYTHSWMRALFVILGSMNVQGPVIFWAATHRRHHRYSDRNGDPHSPYLLADGREIAGLRRGVWHAHVGWLFAPEVTAWGYYVPELLRDRLILKLNRLYFIWVLLGLVMPAAIGGLLAGTWMGALGGFLWGGLVRIFAAQQSTWAVNSFCHVYGSRPFQAPDNSGNIPWLAISTVGGAWHNNHHAFPNSAMHGLYWWQIDLSGLLIRSLSWLGLTWKIVIPTRNQLNARSKKL